MDAYASGGIGATIVVILGIILKFVDHKRCRSSCCGWSASVAVEDVTPKPEGSEEKEKENSKK